MKVGAIGRPRAIAQPVVGVWLVLLGGWLLNMPNGWTGALIVMIGLALAGAQIGSRNPAHLAALCIGALMVFGAFTGHAWGVALDQRALAVGIFFVLCAYVAAAPRQHIEQGLDSLPLLGVFVAVWAICWALWTGERGLGPFMLNPNATAGFLIVALAWSLARNTEHLGISSVLVAGLVLTGSRWGMVVLFLVLGYFLIARRMHLAKASLVIGAVGTLFALGIIVTDVLERKEWTPETPGTVERVTYGVSLSYFTERILPDRMPGMLPAGYRGNGDGEGGHNLFSRAAVETGWLGLAIMLLVVGLALKRANAEQRVLLGVLLLLGTMDYYVWGPMQLAPLLWMALALSVLRKDEVGVFEVGKTRHDPEQEWGRCA